MFSDVVTKYFYIEFLQCTHVETISTSLLSHTKLLPVVQNPSLTIQTFMNIICHSALNNSLPCTSINLGILWEQGTVTLSVRWRSISPYPVSPTHVPQTQTPVQSKTKTQISNAPPIQSRQSVTNNNRGNARYLSILRAQYGSRTACWDGCSQLHHFTTIASNSPPNIKVLKIWSYNQSIPTPSLCFRSHLIAISISITRPTIPIQIEPGKHAASFLFYFFNKYFVFVFFCLTCHQKLAPDFLVEWAIKQWHSASPNGSIHSSDWELLQPTTTSPHSQNAPHVHLSPA